MKYRILFLMFLFTIASLVYGQGCMSASSDEGVNVVGYLQAQYEYQFGENEDTNTFTFNRARMGLVGNIPYDFSYYIMFEFSPNKEGAPYLLDGFITYSRFSPYVSLSLGQFKSPFSLELNTPCQGLYTVKRSEVVNVLASPDRDRGIMFTGNYNDLVKYSFAFMNGTGRESLDDNENKTFAGRVVVSPIEYVNLGVSYKTGTSLSPDPTIEEEDEKTRTAFDLELTYNDFLFQGEYIVAEDIGSHLKGGGD
ncbi:MAG: OprO/OprP family phosphate-selective porin [Candidatus Cloacimonetes bacterium]|nr:OprO/OprP family phosphate-selective porin [Candidatus Cloacimonadota bacterium]